MRKLTLVLTLTLTLVALAPLAHAGCSSANAHTSREARQARLAAHAAEKYTAGAENATARELEARAIKDARQPRREEK